MSDLSPPASAPDSLIGHTIDGYEILRRLGAGGMGEVYIARHLLLNSLRAFKVIGTDVASQSAAEARFRREARAMARLAHASIVPVVDSGRLGDGSLYIVMQLVEGHDLQQLVERNGTFGVRDTVRILEQIADAMVFAHRHDIVHRDLKPQNVLLADDDPGQVRIIDFGLVKMVGDETMTKLTADGQILGSPLYMSPEQGMSGEIGPAADIYALGGLGYFLLSGRPPFLADNLPGLIMAHCFDTPERIEVRCRHLSLPPVLPELLFDCLAKQPAARPTATGLLANLGSLYAQIPDEPPPTPGPRTPPPPAVDPAELIWSDDDLQRQTGAGSGIRAALANQITTLLLAVGDALRERALLDTSAGQALDRAQELQALITDLEMDAALIDSQIQDSVAPITPEAEQQLGEVRARVAGLKAEERRHLRALYAAIRTADHAGPVPGNPPLQQLRDLVARYLDLHGASTA